LPEIAIDPVQPFPNSESATTTEPSAATETGLPEIAIEQPVDNGYAVPAISTTTSTTAQATVVNGCISQNDIIIPEGTACDVETSEVICSGSSIAQCACI
jgi:hypothetical protein